MKFLCVRACKMKSKKMKKINLKTDNVRILTTKIKKTTDF